MADIKYEIVKVAVLSNPPQVGQGSESCVVERKEPVISGNGITDKIK